MCVVPGCTNERVVGPYCQPCYDKREAARKEGLDRVRHAPLKKAVVKKKSKVSGSSPEPSPGSLNHFLGAMEGAEDFVRTRLMLPGGKILIPTTGLVAVPRRIHFIWIGPQGGGDPIPEKYVKHITTMAERNTGYRVTVWTDHVGKRVPNIAGVEQADVWQEAPSLIGELNGSKLIAELLKLALKVELTQTRNFAAVSDILRVLILYRYGGIYCDTDNVPLLPFPDPLLVFGMRVGQSGSLGAITNALMASVDHFPFFRFLAFRIACNVEHIYKAMGGPEPYAKRYVEARRLSNYGLCNTIVNTMSGPLCLNLLMECTSIGGMKTCAAYLRAWQGFAIPPRFVKVGSDQTWLQADG